MKKGINLNKELLNLRRLMEEGKIKFYKDMAEDLRKVMVKSDGTIVEETVSGRIKEVLLELRGKGE